MTNAQRPQGAIVRIEKPVLKPRKTRDTTENFAPLAMEVKRALNRIVSGKNSHKLLRWREQNRKAAAAAPVLTQASSSSAPSQNPPEFSPLSSLESLLSTAETHGYPSAEPARSTPSGNDFIAALSNFSPNTMKTVTGFITGLTGTKRAMPDTAPESPSLAAAHCRKLNSTEREEVREPGTLILPKDIHPEVMCLADAKAYVPLHLFTTTARKFLFTSGSLPMTEGDKKGLLLDVSAAVFGTPKEHMSEAEWCNAVPFFSQFLTQTGDVAWSER